MERSDRAAGDDATGAAASAADAAYWAATIADTWISAVSASVCRRRSDCAVFANSAAFRRRSGRLGRTDAADGAASDARDAASASARAAACVAAAPAAAVAAPVAADANFAVRASADSASR